MYVFLVSIESIYLPEYWMEVESLHLLISQQKTIHSSDVAFEIVDKDIPLQMRREYIFT